MGDGDGFGPGLVMGLVIGAFLGAFLTDCEWSKAAIKGGQAHYDTVSGEWKWDGWKIPDPKKQAAATPACKCECGCQE